MGASCFPLGKTKQNKTLLLPTASFSVSWGWLLFLFVLGNTSLFVLPYSKILCLNPYSYILHVMVEKENFFTLLFLRSTSNFRRNSQGSLWGFQVEWDWVLLYRAADFLLITYMYWGEKWIVVRFCFCSCCSFFSQLCSNSPMSSVPWFGVKAGHVFMAIHSSIWNLKPGVHSWNYWWEVK